MIITPQIRILLAVGAGLLLVWIGWAVNGWRLTATHDRERAAWREAADAKLKTATDARDALAERLKESDDAHLDALEKKDAENKALRDRVAAGTVGLRVAAKCPAVVRVSEAASGAGVDSGAGAELDPGARSNYFALLDGLARFESKLSACQSQLRGRLQ